MSDVRGKQAFRVLFDECTIEGLSVRISECFQDRQLKIAIHANSGGLVAAGWSYVKSPDGYPLMMETAQGKATIADDTALRRFIQMVCFLKSPVLQETGPITLSRPLSTVDQIQIDLLNLTTPELVSLRDRLNEVIYDREKGRP